MNRAYFIQRLQSVKNNLQNNLQVIQTQPYVTSSEKIIEDGLDDEYIYELKQEIQLVTKMLQRLEKVSNDKLGLSEIKCIKEYIN
jgi:hypothetical protein